MKVLLGWELGAGQSHLHFLATLAQRLHDRGVECIFALRHFNIKHVHLPGTIVCAPRLPFSGREISYTFADILETFGFANPFLLRSHLQQWEQVLNTLKPNLVIADSAPGLVLATTGRVPTIVVGPGFTVPPRVAEFPILRFPAPPQSFQHQEQVTNTVRAVTGCDQALGDLLNGDCSFIYSIPEIDPYRHLRDLNTYIGIHIAPIPKNLYHREGEVWAYLSDDYPARDLVLKTLRPRSDFTPITNVGKGKALFIHHGGTVTTITCLLAGIPQLLLPHNLEQWLISLSLEQLRVGKMLTQPTQDNLMIAQAQAYALAEPAQQQTQNLSHWNQNLMERVVDSCFGLLS